MLYDINATVPYYTIFSLYYHGFVGYTKTSIFKMISVPHLKLVQSQFLSPKNKFIALIYKYNFLHNKL